MLLELNLGDRAAAAAAAAATAAAAAASRRLLGGMRGIRLHELCTVLREGLRGGRRQQRRGGACQIAVHFEQRGQRLGGRRVRWHHVQQLLQARAETLRGDRDRLAAARECDAS